MPNRHMTVDDAGEAAVLITESIQYADAQAKLATGDPDALAFPAILHRVWTADDVLGHRDKFPTSAVYEERGRMMAVTIAQHATVAGTRVFQPVIGGIRISEIAPDEHEAYLYMPLRMLVPEAIAQGIHEHYVLYDPRHQNLDASLKRFSTANGIRDVGQLREYRGPLRLDEITGRSRQIEGRDARNQR